MARQIPKSSSSFRKKSSGRFLRKETPAQTRARIDKAIEEFEAGKMKLISFTAAEFEKFSKKPS